MSLGKLFGGNIAGINYNFQPSSQPSSATILIVNEKEEYQLPNFGSTVNLPVFGMPMTVVSRTFTQSKYKTLQIEVVDKLHEILDKELVLIYGLHTDHQSKLNDQFYWTFKSYFVDERYWKAPRNPRMEEPVYPSRNQRGGGGINILGFARATINDIKSTPVNEGYDFEPDATYLKFDKGILRNDISTANSGDWEFDENGPPNLSIQYGYTLSELKALLIKLGIRFADGSGKYLDDTTVLFNDAGTLRQVLSSALSKIGMSFYVDPLSQKIKVITNADIAKINTNIKSLNREIDNDQCATQMSYSETVKGIDAKHIVLKGDLNQVDLESGGDSNGNSEPVRRTDKLYRLAARDITKRSSDELNYIYRFLPLILMGLPNHVIEAYIFGTAVYEDETDWGDLYGENDLKLDDESFWRKDAEVEDGVSNRQKIFWDAVIANGPSYNFFDADTNGETAKLLYKLDDNGSRIDPTPVTDDYIPYMQDFAQMWGGIYISDAMNFKEAEARVYSTRTKREQSVTTFIANQDSFISEYNELNFLTNLLQKGGNRSSSVTIRQLAQNTKSNLTPSRTAGQSGANTDIVGSRYHVIAIQKLSIPNIDELPQRLAREIGANLVKYNIPVFPNGSNTFVLGTKGFKSLMKSMRKTFDRILRDSTKKRYDYILLSYFKTKEDTAQPNNDNAENPFHDKGLPNFLRNIPAQEKCFYQRSLDVRNMSVSEAEFFLRNAGTLNPTTPCPLVTATIRYNRPPTISDFDIENGLSNINITVNGEGGISTTITYSSLKFVNIDPSISRDYLGSSNSINRTSIPSMEPNYKPSFLKDG